MFAQGRFTKGLVRNLDLGKAPAVETTKVRANVTGLRPNAVLAAGLRETLIASEVTIAPGDAKIIEANTDFSGTEKIALAVLTPDDKNKLSNIAVGVAWAAPNEWYTMTGFELGSDILLADSHGGFTTSVYGPYLKVAILNTGTTPIRIKQLTVYAAAR